MAHALSDRLLLAQTKLAGLRPLPPALTDREAFIEALILVSAADEEIVSEEMETLTEVLSQIEVFQKLSQEEITDTIGRALKRVMTEDPAARAKAIAKALRHEEVRKLTFRWACAVAISDGDIPEVERAILRLLQHEFGLSDQEVQETLDEATGPRD
jgi:tellurite resistance protein